MTTPIGNQDPPGPLASLSRSDQDLIVQLTLHSGSLKALAKTFGVSYPTIRRRLDEVIERLRTIVEGRLPEPMAELLADLVRRGEITPTAARAVRDLHRTSATTQHDTANLRENNE